MLRQFNSDKYNLLLFNNGISIMKDELLSTVILFTSVIGGLYIFSGLMKRNHVNDSVNRERIPLREVDPAGIILREDFKIDDMEKKPTEFTVFKTGRENDSNIIDKSKGIFKSLKRDHESSTIANNILYG